MAEKAKEAEGAKRPKEPLAAETRSESGAVEVRNRDAAEPRRMLAPFWDLDREFERALENFFNRGWPSAPRWEIPRLAPAFREKVPNVNVIDRDDELVVEAELPGVEKDELDVSLSENTLTIKASTRKEEKKEEGEYHRHEISTGFFSRTLPLPVAVEGDKVKAEFKNGVLRLTLPKSEQSKRLTIKVD